MAGLFDLASTIPPYVMGNGPNPALAISSPGQALAECRLVGSNDPTYGTLPDNAGWNPRTDGQPFGLIYPGYSQEIKSAETNRIHTRANIALVIALVHATTPAVKDNYLGRGLQWIDSARLWIPSYHRLYPASTTISPTMGDVIWDMSSGDIDPERDILGTKYYCAVIQTVVTFVTAVTYQQ